LPFILTPSFLSTFISPAKQFATLIPILRLISQTFHSSLNLAPHRFCSSWYRTARAKEKAEIKKKFMGRKQKRFRMITKAGIV
jgi:hypothetical protein